MFNTDKGGIYTWVKAAFGSSWGLAAVWLQWIQNVVWYPVVLGFTAATLAYLIGDPNLANSHIFNFAVVLVVYWLATGIALFGERSYGNWSQFLFVHNWHGHSWRVRHDFSPHMDRAWEPN